MEKVLFFTRWRFGFMLSSAYNRWKWRYKDGSVCNSIHPLQQLDSIF